MNLEIVTKMSLLLKKWFRTEKFKQSLILILLFKLKMTKIEKF